MPHICILAAQIDDGSSIIIAGTIVAIVLGVIQLLDRLYLKPKKERESGCQATAIGTQIESAVLSLTQQQRELTATVSDLTSLQKTNLEVSRVRHEELLRSLERSLVSRD